MKDSRPAGRPSLWPSAHEKSADADVAQAASDASSVVYSEGEEEEEEDGADGAISDEY